jgi:hypothetical protein
LGGAGAVALVGVLAIADASPADARCRDQVTGQQASGRVRFFTEGKARRSWGERARRYGAEYANWSLARDKTMNCYKGAPGQTWYCRARGRPCNRPPA